MNDFNKEVALEILANKGDRGDDEDDVDDVDDQDDVDDIDDIDDIDNVDDVNEQHFSDDNEDADNFYNSYLRKLKLKAVTTRNVDVASKYRDDVLKELKGTMSNDDMNEWNANKMTAFSTFYKYRNLCHPDITLRKTMLEEEDLSEIDKGKLEAALQVK